MALVNVTYKDLIDKVSEWIKSNCENYYNYNNLPNVYKETSPFGLTQFDGKGDGKTYYQFRIYSETIVQRVSEATINNDINTYISYIGISDTNKKIPMSEFLHFMENLVIFICSKCFYASSQFDVTNNKNNVHIIYKSNAPINKSFVINTGYENKRIDALDVLDLFDIFVNIVKENLRSHIVKYEVDVGSNSDKPFNGR